ncbi:MAG: hypothetical protein V4503_10930 [Gemmatimonadota bacterium]
MSSESERFQEEFEAAFTWVEAHRDALPVDLAALSAYPMQFRRVIVNHVSPEIRAAMWCDHLRSFLGPHSELSGDDQAFLQDLIADLPVAFIGPAETARQRFESFSKRSEGRFPPALAGRLFQTIGPPEPPGGLPLPPEAAP